MWNLNKRLLQCVLFSVWFLPCNIIFIRFTLIIYSRILFFFISVYYSTISSYLSYLVLIGKVNCFHTLATANNAAINILAPACGVWNLATVGITGPRHTSMSCFSRHLQFLKTLAASMKAPKQWLRLLIAPHSCHHVMMSTRPVGGFNLPFFFFLADCCC